MICFVQPGEKGERILKEIDSVYSLETSGSKVSLIYSVSDDGETTLYRYSGGSSAPIAKDVNSNTVVAVDDVCLYQITGDSEWRQNVGGKESALRLDDDETIDGVYTLNGTELLIETGSGELQSYKIGSDALAFTKTITDDCLVCTKVKLGGKEYLYYFSEWSGSGNLMQYADGSETLVARDVEDAFVYESLVLCKEDGTLYASKSGKNEKVSDDVNRFAPLSARKVLYITDEDLYLWNGSKSERVARDAKRIWTNAGLDCLGSL